MGIFSLNWFKTEKQKELEALQLENAKLENKLLKDRIVANENKIMEKKPYKKVKLVGDVLTIILHNGDILSKTNAKEEDFNKVRQAVSEEELFKLIPSTIEIEEKRTFEKKLEDAKQLLKGVEVLKECPEFIVKEDSIYMKPAVTRSLPKLLIGEFSRILSGHEALQSEEYQSLKKFWLKCCLNPNAQSAEDLYTFLTHHQFKIDRHGNFYAYRNVVSREESKDRELVDFISNTYNKVKAVWKKKPSLYSVWKQADGSFTFEKGVGTGGGVNLLIGNLEELYKNLPDMQGNNYTDSHTKTFDYKVGEVISMPRNDGDDNNNVSCSKGFHAASKQYDYSGFGDTSILVIINPMDVLAVPLGEVGKLRTCRWFFAAVLSKDEKHILDDEDFDVTDLGDIFEEKCLENLTEHIQNSFAEEVKRHTFTLPTITGKEINNIVLSLEEMKKTIASRVNTVE